MSHCFCCDFLYSSLFYETVVKHPLVEEVHQVEIDDRVIEVAKKYLPFMACGFDSNKVHLTCGDGFEYMKQRKGEFDVIITDSSDPVGPAKSLFQVM